MSENLHTLAEQARRHWGDIRVEALIEILSAALRDLYRATKELELELIRHQAFLDEPDYASAGPGKDRREGALRIQQYLADTRRRVRTVQSLQAVLRALDTPYAVARDFDVLRGIFLSPRERAPTEEARTLPRYVYALSVLGRTLHEKEREYLASYASDMTGTDCNVRPNVTVEATDEVVPEGWDPNDDGTV